MSIPQKSNFRLDEVCKITGVKPYIIRFWESEFPEINPMTNSSGQKIYEHKDVKLVNEIKELMFEKKLSLERVKQILISGTNDERSITHETASVDLEDLESDAVKKLRALVSRIETLKRKYNLN